MTITEPIQSEPLRIPSNLELLSGWPDIEWDEYRRITKITSASGEITTYEYFDDDDRALVKARTFPDGRREEYTRSAAAFAFNVMLPFTQPLSLRNDADICEGTQSRVGFTGYFYNCTTKTYYTPSGRWYDPEIARFQQQDSYLGKIEDAPSLHRYTYAHNNPTRYVDPTGHAAGDIWDPRSYDWGTFGKEAVVGTIEKGANGITFGGYGGVKEGIKNGDIDFSQPLSVPWRTYGNYVAGVGNTVTMGAYSNAADARGKGESVTTTTGAFVSAPVVNTYRSVKANQQVLENPNSDGWSNSPW